jgi:hypothetical protein
MKPPSLEINLAPTQLAQLRSAEPMPERQQDRSAVPGTVSSSAAGSIDELGYLLLC